MTELGASLSFVPMAIVTGTCAEVQRPLTSVLSEFSGRSRFIAAALTASL
jgi:hypothetical protein